MIFHFSSTKAKELDPRLLFEQLRLVNKQIPIVVLGLLGCTLAIVYLMWPSSDPVWLVIWLSAILISVIHRLWLYRRFGTLEMENEVLNHWLLHLKVMSLFSGFVWGGGLALLLTPENPMAEYLVAATTAGLAGGAISSYAAVKRLSLLYIAPAVGLLALYFLMGETQGDQVLGVLGVLFLLSLILISRNMNRSTIESLQLRLTNQDLVTELKSSEEKFRGVVENSSDGIVIIQDERITYVNKAVEEISGYTTEELLGSQFQRYLSTSTDGLKQIRERLRAREAKQSVSAQFEVDIRHKSGQERRLIVSSTEFFLEGAEVGVAMIKDITNRKQAEMELLAAKERAEDATRLKDRFVSLVAHDLKSPLSSMLGMASMLASDGENPLGNNQQKLVNLIQQSGQNLIHTIEELLNLDRLKSGQIIPAPRFFDASQQIQEVSRLMGYLAEDKGIGLVNEVPPATRLFADPQLFSKVIQNLVNNGIKFCSKGDQIIIGFEPGERKTILVRDTGKGMDARKIAGLFHAGAVVSTPGTAGEQGTGHGLKFCHEIMKAHGGEIQVESEPGKGTTFRVVFPEEKLNVLLVGETEAFESILNQSFDSIEVNFFQAGDSARAMELLNEVTFHLMLADQKTPGLENGMELLPQLRNHPRGVGVPLIFLVDPQDVEGFESALRHGATDILSRPVPVQGFSEWLRVFRN